MPSYGTEKSRNKPNLFVIGAPKAGTSAFVSALSQFSEVYVPYYKEPRYFDANIYFDHNKDYPFCNIADYLKLYDNDESIISRYRLDGSVFNMYSEYAIKSILEMSPDAKFILILRDPFDAVKSMFEQRLKYSDPIMREISDDFTTCWNMLEQRKKGFGFPQGCRNKFLFRYDLLYSYEKYIPFLKALIPSENLLIIKYADLKYDAYKIFNQTKCFLKIESKFLPTNKIVNPSKRIRPTIVAMLMARLATRTVKIRKKLGLTGSKMKAFRFLLKGKDIDAVDANVDIITEMEVRSSFAATYQYLGDNFFIQATRKSKR